MKKRQKRYRKLFLVYLGWLMGICEKPGVVTARMHITGSLKEKLKANRSNRQGGKGDEYWDSVIKVIENHYGKQA